MKIYTFAANWWAEKIKSTNGSLITDKKLKKFKESLSAAIKKQIKAGKKVELDVDYFPNDFLLEIACKTGISINAFPKKTTMWITEKKVSVKDGYGARTEVIFGK